MRSTVAGLGSSFTRVVALILLLTGSARSDYSFSTIASFDGTNGRDIIPGVTLDANGNIYGAATAGSVLANTNSGSIYEIVKGSNTITTLATFNGGTNGLNPSDSLTFDSNGNLFGVTTGRFGNSVGGVFEVPAGSNGITQIASFDSNDGAPIGPLVFDAAGNMYGLFAIGGANNVGRVFEIAKGSNTVTTVASLDSTHDGSLTIDSQGNLFGSTYSGIFEITHGTNTLSYLVHFGPFDQRPISALTVATDGTIYGTSFGSGGNGTGPGTVFEFNPSLFTSGTITPTVSTLATLPAPGDSITGSLVLDARGNLFGTIAGDSGTNYGGVFEIVSGSNQATILHRFNGSDGSTPYSGLSIDANGNLFGTTQNGGLNNDGTVFELSPNAVPEPSAILLLGVGIAGLVVIKHRRKVGI